MAKRYVSKLLWLAGVLLIASLVALPLFYIVLECLAPATENWQNLTEKDPTGLLQMLPPDLRQEIAPTHTLFYLRLQSTLLVLAGVLTVSSLLGIALAWLLSAYAVPYRRWLTVLLALPLAIPSYIMAASFRLLTDDWYLAEAIAIREKQGPDAMHRFDLYWRYMLAIATLTCAFFPYIFLAARTAFSTLSREYLEASRTLGHTLACSMRKIALPLARPAILGGVMLASLETLNEYGAMKIIGIETLLTEIFKIRSGTNDLNTAVRLAGTIMTIIFGLLCLELLLRGRKKFHASRTGGLETAGASCSRLRVVLTISFCLSVFAISFLLPVTALVLECRHAPVGDYLAATIAPALDSLTLTASACLVVLGWAIFLCLAQRNISVRPIRVLTKLCTLGYAVPGAILGISILAWTGAALQNLLTSGLTEIIFYSSSAGLVLAYSIRFLTVAIHPLESGYEQIPPSLDEASRLLRRRFPVTLFRLHLPLLRPSILAALIILAVDIIKELPLTLILSPFNTETLAMHTYSMFAVQEDYPRAAVPALILVATCTLCILCLQAFLKNRPTTHLHSHEPAPPQ